jgi:hypothetical protein
MNEELRTLLYSIGGVVVVCLLLATVSLALVYRRLRRIQLPPNADFWTTIRAVPLGLAIGLDLLDLSLDVLATPIVWVILSRFRLQALRNVAAVEAFIPFTQAIPTFTVAWIAARILNLGQQRRFADRRIIDTDPVGRDRYVPRTGRR